MTAIYPKINAASVFKKKKKKKERKSRRKWGCTWLWEGAAFSLQVPKKKFKNEVLYFGPKQINNFYSPEETEACYKRPYPYKIPVDFSASGLLNWTHCGYTGNISHWGTVQQKLVYR